MDYMPIVVKAEYIKGHELLIVFDNGVEKRIDLKNHLKGPVFAPLKDVEYFKRFFLDGWTVAWPNGADLAPEFLYENGTVVGKKDFEKPVPRKAAAQPSMVAEKKPSYRKG